MPNEGRRQELIGIIEEAFLTFTANLTTPDGQIRIDAQQERFSMRRTIPTRPVAAALPIVEVDPFEEDENADWESDDESSIVADKENQPPPATEPEPEKGPDLLGRIRSRHTVACRLRVLSQIHELLVMNRHATKRDLYYECKSLYVNQSNFDRALSAVCKFLNATRIEVHVMSCSKGFAIGHLRLCNAMDESEVDFRHSPVAITEPLTKFDFVDSDAHFLLIVEKDSVFQRLLDEHWLEKFPKSILLTGRGYPDICTRQFLAWLSSHLPRLPMLALVDADPYGIETFLTYKFGSKRSRVESGDVQLPRLEWLGFFPSEAAHLAFPQDQFLELSESDQRRVSKLAERMVAEGEQSISDELSILLQNNWKLELEAISSLGHHFLSSVYLNYKLQQYQN